MNYHPPEDQLILLGDYVDRGPDSKAVVEQVMKLQEEWGVVTLKGNHDQMACDAITGDDDKLDTHWLSNGGFHTMISYFGTEPEAAGQFGWKEYMKMKEVMRKDFKHHLDFLNTRPLYYESDSHLFVHAGIDPALADWRTQRAHDFIWIRKPFYAHPVTNTDKMVVFGHTPTIDLQDSAGIWFSPHGDKIGIDGACAYGEQLNGLEITEGGYTTHFVRLGEY